MSERKKILIWHPKVHYLYGERLFFIMIRMRKFGSSSLDNIMKLFYQKVGGFCFYTVFGQWDVLIRAWMIDDLKDVLVKEFKGCLNVRDVTCIKVEKEGVYHRAFDKDLEVSILMNAGNYKAVEYLQNQVRKWQSTQTDLPKEGFAILEEGSNKGTKFFCLISSREEGSGKRDVFKEQCSSLIVDEWRKMERVDAISELSVYLLEDNSMADIVVKGVGENIKAIGDFVMTDLRERLKNLSFETTTLLTIDRLHESDDISEVAIASYSEDTPAKWITDKFGESFYIFSGEKMSRALIILKKYADFLTNFNESEFATVLGEFFKAIGTDDAYALARAVSPWLTLYEHRIQELKKEILEFANIPKEPKESKELKESWDKIWDSLDSKVKEQVKKGKGKLDNSLGFNLLWCNNAIKEYSRIKEPIMFIKPEEMSQFRNWVHHGVIHRSGFLTENWEKMLKQLIEMTKQLSDIKAQFVPKKKEKV